MNTAERSEPQTQNGSAISHPASYQSLCDRLGLDQGIPYTDHWSAAADFLSLIVDHCLAARPGVVLECSSGLTTLMLARCCRMNGHGHVYSLENGEQYAQATRDALDRYGLGQQTTVIHAPLLATPLGDRTFQWYDTKGLHNKSIDMLVIDGPPGFIQPHSRYPAMPRLMDRMAPDCRIYLDDAAREDERELVARWLEEYPHIRHRYVETQRGCSVLSLEQP